MADGLVITGPTAVGKSDVAIAVAQRLDGEIISMDSRQVYRRMDIGTAKVTPAQRSAVPHHGLDLLEPDARYSAGRFARDARRWIVEIRARGHVPVLVGGTGFFLRALTEPLFSEPVGDTERRERLKWFLDTVPPEELRRWLAVLDPESGARLAHAGGRQRLARAVEVALLTGVPLSQWHREQASATDTLRLVTICLELPREELYRRINLRVSAMLDAGLVQEVEALAAAGYDERAPAMNATGYIEVLRYLRGAVSLDEAADQIRNATRAYARRQLTWFRHQLPPDTLRLDAARPLPELVDAIEQHWKSCA